MKGGKILMVIGIWGLMITGCQKQDVPGETVKVTQEITETAGVTQENTENGTAWDTEKLPQTEASAGAFTEEDAIAAALDHAQVTETDVTAYQVKRDTDDGVEIYEVEFYVGEREYDYEISMSDGSILKSGYEIEDDFRMKDTSNEGEITAEEAKRIALGKVPGASMIYLEREEDDGRIVYEGEIYHEHREYEFKIDAFTGDILEWEQD